jgi:hypothetical protein
MFSPVKAVTAGAVVFALGGVLLIAQPFDRQGGIVPGAETDAQPEAPVSVTGSARPGPCPQRSKYEVVGDVLQERGGRCNPYWTMSDSRLSGTATWMGTTDTYDDGSALSVGYRAISVENDDGVWREVPQVIIDFPGAVDPETRLTVFEGEGAYQGLVAVLEATETASGATYAGFIFDRGLPPIPENLTTE